MKSFAVFVFYFISIAPICWELTTLMNVRRRFASKNSMKLKQYKEYNKDEKNLGFLFVGYLIWTFFGLFSSQWIIFAFILLLSTIPKKWIWFFTIDAFVSVILLFFLIINQYHLHINVLELIKSFL